MITHYDLPTDPPDGPDPIPCTTCGETGKVCDWCCKALPGLDTEHDEVCTCAVFDDEEYARTLTAMERLGYVRSFEERAGKCMDCDGRGWS